MKVLLINGSPHASGCTYTALSEVASSLEGEKIDTQIVQVGNRQLFGCSGCCACKKTQKCVYDDIVNETAPLFAAADGLVIGSPVHYGAPAGSLLAFLSRLFYSTPHIDKSMKVGAAVVSARRSGCTASFDVLNKYFTISGMPVASSQYWNNIHGHTAEDAKKDEEGLRTMRVLGRNMAFLIKSIASTKEKYGLPQEEPRVFTHFIR